MRRGCRLEPLRLSPPERERLQQWVHRRKTANALSRRARIILLSASGMSNTDVAEKVGVTKQVVGEWRKRFLARRLDGLLDNPRPGAPRRISDKDVERVITLTLEGPPRDATHWSTRSMAKACGLNQTAISRIWRAFALQPHRTRSFKLSTDPLFIEKVRDIVGLYMNPPDRALVLCTDEKSQIQALDRTQPIFPMRPGLPEGRTHDYRRYGTTSLFAALDIQSGKVIGKCYNRHRAIEFKKFLTLIDTEVPEPLDVHLVLDNYATHKTPAIHRWLARRPRFHLHFTPTGASWLNLVESWFSILTRKQVRRGTHRSMRQLVSAIMNYLDHSNDNPKPFAWIKTADEIIESVGRFCTDITQDTRYLVHESLSASLLSRGASYSLWME
jgi:transposase